MQTERENNSLQDTRLRGYGWVWLTVSWFGVSGCFKHVRGTWGTLAALPFAYVVQVNFGNAALGVFGIALFALGVIASNKYVAATGRQDPGEIVIDEVAAVCMLLAFMAPNWQCYLTAFIVFRIFDIIKPWPVCVADKKLKGGFGVMFDDVLAALYPLAIFAILSLLNPNLTKDILAWLQLQ
ncbi:MAG: phosphatidylglycerophosphatase A [Alphaproteobacteria bacterium]|nr:phosphatidylglycerophosphatase A [Alphaproteobacteria bacterium]